MKSLLWLTLAACVMLSADSAFAQTSQDKIVFQKVLPQKQTLIVLEKEVPYTIPPEVKALGPNAHIGVPDHVYLYTFLLRSDQKTKILWTPTRNYFSGADFSSDPAMKVQDAIISQGKLCVVYKQIGITEANIITPGAPLNKPGIPWADSTLIMDSEAGLHIDSAAITGSLEKNDLAVELTDSDTKHYRYHLLKNKWVKDAPLSAATEPAMDNMVFQKQLFHQQSIQVLKHEIANVPPKEAPPAGLVYIKPDHIYQYDFILIGPKDQKRKIWSHEFLSFAATSSLPTLPTDFEVFDADVQGETLIVVYKGTSKIYGGTTFANIVNDISKNSKKELSRNDAQLTYDSDARGIYITAAKITGSIGEKTLTVNLKNVNSTLSFLWKDQKWQSVSEAAPDPAKK